jgi:hypothetical protein
MYESTKSVFNLSVCSTILPNTFPLFRTPYSSHIERWRCSFTCPRTSIALVNTAVSTAHDNTAVSKSWYDKTGVYAVELERKLMLH